MKTHSSHQSLFYYEFMAMEFSSLDYFTIKVPGIFRPQKLFMMAWNSRDIHGFLFAIYRHVYFGSPDIQY